MSIKEKKKKVYVKPAITVAEWDFDKAVCDDNIMLLSTCNIHSETGRSDIKINTFRGSIDNWNDYDEVISSNNRGF